MRRFLVPVAIAAVMLVVLEGAVRLAFPEIGPLDTDRRLIRDNVFGTSAGIAPNATGVSHGALFTSDAYGFWKYESAADTSLPAWLLIGDSVTMGIGVDPDSTFAGILVASLDSVAVLNASLIGYSVADYARALNALLSEDPPHPYRIASVSVVWCLNDVYADLTAGNPNQNLRQSLGRPLSWIRRHFYTYQWLKNAVTDRAADYYEFDRAFYENDARYVERSVALLVQMRQLAARRQVSFNVVLLPYRHQLTSGDADVFLPQRLLAGALERVGVPVTDLSNLEGSRVRPERLYRFGDGIHFSAAGHRRLAERLMANR